MNTSATSYLAKFRESESSTSVIFGAIVLVIATLLILNFISSNRMAQVTPEGQTTEVQETGTNLPLKHLVKKGEHLWGIAELYYKSGYNWVDIAKANSFTEKTILVPGMELTIPVATALKPTVKPVTTTTISGDSYVVVKGDSLWTISVRAYGDGYKWTELWKANRALVKNPNHITVGMKLTLVR